MLKNKWNPSIMVTFEPEFLGLNRQVAALDFSFEDLQQCYLQMRSLSYSRWFKKPAIFSQICL